MPFRYFYDFYNYINTSLTNFSACSSDFSFPQWDNFKFPEWKEVSACYPTFDFSNCMMPNTDTFVFSKQTNETKQKQSPFAGYNEATGEKLSAYVKKHAKGFSEGCAKAVSDTLAKTGLSNGKRGHAYQMNSILSNNTHFKEVPVTSIKDTTSIPKGAILVYDKGVCGYNKEYGHVEVAIGNGKAASDGIQNIKGMPSAVFIPV